MVNSCVFDSHPGLPQFPVENSKNQPTNDFEKNGNELFSPEKFQPYLSVIS